MENSSKSRSALRLDFSCVENRERTCRIKPLFAFTTSYVNSNTNTGTNNHNHNHSNGTSNNNDVQYNFNSGIILSPNIIDVNLSIEFQSWYHGRISKFDAEKKLKNSKTGSFIVWISDSNKCNYFISLKSVRGYIHIKINRDDNNLFSLFTENDDKFDSIPKLIKHYHLNKLPIRGASHLSLIYPIIDQLL